MQLFSNFRTFKYFKRVESSTDDTGKFFEILSVDEMLDPYGTNKKDVAYVAGRVLELRSSVEFRYAIASFYVFPIVVEASYSSWAAEMYPWAIIYEAARTVMATLGQMEEANGMSVLAREQLQILKNSSILDIGY